MQFYPFPSSTSCPFLFSANLPALSTLDIYLLPIRLTFFLYTLEKHPKYLSEC
nr:MAG TPA: hypothetical protein [Caudoviricetes sp.]